MVHLAPVFHEFMSEQVNEQRHGAREKNKMIVLTNIISRRSNEQVNERAPSYPMLKRFDFERLYHLVRRCDPLLVRF